MANNRDIQRQAHQRVGPTCPAVDAALAAAAEAIKEQTSALRDALCEAIERAIDAEGTISELESQIDGLKRDLESFRADLRDDKESA